MLRLRQLGSSFRIKLFQTLDKFQFADDIDPNDYLRVTGETLTQHAGQTIKLLTFPHNPIKDQSDMFEKVARVAEGRTVLFDWDPCKVLRLGRQIASQLLRVSDHTTMPAVVAKNLYSLLQVDECILDANLLRQYISAETEQSKGDLKLLLRGISEKLLTKSDEQMSNTNVFAFWAYLLLQAEGRLGFAGIPHPLLYAKLAQFTDKEQIVLSFIRWTRFLEEQLRNGTQRSIAGIFETPHMIKFQLFMDAKFLRGNYLLELAKAIAETKQRDLCIVADPLMKKTLDRLIHMKKLYGQFPLMGNSEAAVAAEEEYCRGMEEVVSPQSLEEVKREIDHKKRMGMPITEDNEDPFKQNFADFVRLEDLQNSPEKVDDMIFKIAVWDTFFETKVLESPFVDNKFFFISREPAFFTPEKVDELERKFHICYRSIQKLKESITTSIRRWERPIGVEEALLLLQKDTKIQFKEIDYYAQEDDSAHRAYVEHMQGG